MILRNGERGSSPAQQTPVRCAGVSGKSAVALLALALLPMVLLACTSESSAFGQYFKGRTLHVSVVSLERLPELHYSTIDPLGVIRRWSIAPSTEGMELVMVRARVENHTAVSAIINVDRAAAELRDFANATYRPLSVAHTAWRDYREEPEALVRMDLGQCFDGARALIDQGSSVQWLSESEDAQYIAFDDAAVVVGPEGRAEIAPGAAVSYTFSQAGNYPYVCGDSEGAMWAAEIQVMPPGSGADAVERTTLFLNGAHKLLRGHGVDGFLVFEAPAGTQFRDMRWRAGDSITIRF